ncbi:MAG: site-specific DNA-methyltransferase [Candidatus Pacebacteria bacterium]|nr:site-specific DNA-methyltransferase [Candidatus Paceibacterota bacterium]
MHDGSEEVLEGFPETSKSTGGGGVKTTSKLVYGDYKGKEYDKVIGFGDEGSAARFFYCPKVSKSERNRGLDKNNHPTVKPVELMKYLCRLVTPKGGIVLDPFMGSGSTGMAAKDEGFEFIGIEKEKEYYEIAEQRINTTSPLLEFI